MPKRSLAGTILSSREELERCRSLHQELEESCRTKHSFQKQAATERQKELVKMLSNAFTDDRSEVWLANLNTFGCFVRTHLWASEKAIVAKEKGIAIGTRVLLGQWRTPAIVRAVHWDYDVTVEILDPNRKVKIRHWSPLEMEIDPQCAPEQPAMPTSADDHIVIEEDGGSWTAYFSAAPATRGIGGSQAEAIGSLYINEVGKLILRDPKRFGLTIQLK